MYVGLFVKEESEQLPLSVVGEELDFPNAPTGIPCIIVTPTLSTLESSGYQFTVIQSFARSAHSFLCSLKASGVYPGTLSDLLIFLARELGSKAGVPRRVSMCKCPHRLFTSFKGFF